MNSPTPATAFAHAQTPVARLIALKQIVVRDQVRKAFADEDVQELAASIKADGLIQPIVVRPFTGGAHKNGETFQIVAGERRFRAAQLAGLSEIRAEIRDGLSDAGVQVLQLVENVQRTDLSLPEQCDGVAALVKQLEGVDGKTGLQNTADRLGKSLAWVSRRASIVDAPIEIKKLVKSGTVTDVDIAAGLAELKQVAPKDKFERVLNDAEYGVRYGRPFTRETIREVVKDAKADKKRKDAQRAQAAADRKAGKKPKVKDSWQASQAAARAAKDKHIERWKVVGPTVKKFAEAAAKATGLEIEAPRYDGYHVDPVPASIEACAFKWGFNGSGEQAKHIAAKTGVTLKLELELAGVTPEQATKIDQVMGKKLEWGLGWRHSNNKFTGKQLAAMAAKAGTKLELPALAKAEAKPAAAPPAKKKGH